MPEPTLSNPPLLDVPDAFTAKGRAGASGLTHLLHFEPLRANDAGLDIPCDPQGRVGLDALGERLRNDYFFARTLIGRLFAAPTVRIATPLRG
ncbi:hypothetical protein [Pelomonas cellulosilytica]|uniref:Uncharacterized protein n=1 Tax=Pelomonas cellulosilytica TaxID=2906762 RepID=A0ABS8Y037_9BURK|nr:hypothetical protein [Pelomonas sp. P8]MCE4557603.1 hypothetical protein [Pelomonas sp. P8]